ncbi:RNA 2',3'-cyclic phosphodiesterase [Elioraea sp.]|uniref:RNA 2',3'-cyclic phosphodiesterase n=1 Tax=Elioraea sp. TaxID=2185103 RepID=UPI0025C22C40|nr:RNA 2',3'-cyclic phosphodiesterase [Elioraea sp.]
MVRLFVALDLPSQVRERLRLLTGAKLPGARWVPPENMHLTLRFVGEVDHGRADDIDAALAGIAARGFELTLEGVGAFESGRRLQALSLWAGVVRNPALEHLRAKVESAVVRAGCEPERRKFSPHVTLARLDQPDPAKFGAWLHANALFRLGPVAVEHFTLFSSRLGRDGAHYTAEADYPLGQRALQ